MPLRPGTELHLKVWNGELPEDLERRFLKVWNGVYLQILNGVPLTSGMELYLKVWDGELPMHPELETRGRRPVGIQQHVRKLKQN